MYLKNLKNIKSKDIPVLSSFNNINEVRIVNRILYSKSGQDAMSNSLSLKYEIELYNTAIKVMWMQYHELTRLEEEG